MKSEIMSTASETFTQYVSQKKAGDTPGGFAKKEGRLRAALLTLALAGGLFAASGNVPPLDAGKGALYLQKILHQATGSKPAIEKYSGGEPTKNAIVLRKSSDTELGKEDYRIKVTPEAVFIDASAPAGALSGFVMALPLEMIGNNGTWGYKTLNADLDETNIFPKALTTSEIEKLHKEGISSQKR